MAADVPRILLNVWRVLQICAFWFINKRLTEPYMDEIFHVPQAQAYCRGQFANYDPKLTTPPGLYLVSYILHLVGLPCDVAYLRYVNLFVGTILLPSLCSRIWALRHVGANRQDLQWAKCIAMMPLLSFFSLLYYTDVASIYLVLLAYYLVLCKRPASSAAVSLQRIRYMIMVTDLVADRSAESLLQTDKHSLDCRICSYGTRRSVPIHIS